MPELALDDDQRRALTSRLDGMGTPKLARRKAPPTGRRRSTSTSTVNQPSLGSADTPTEVQSRVVAQRAAV